jgi:5-methylcytosine-specific restriction enzyme subunit McrC
VNIPIRNVYYLLAYAWGHADAAEDREADAAPVETLPDLLAWVLAHRTAALLKRGLDRSYVEEGVVLAGVRGKLELATTIKRNLLPQARTACTVEEFRHDILHNQILRSTLRRLLALPRLSPAVRAEVGLVYRKLEGVTEIQVRRSSFRRVRIHRNNRAYHFLMHLCRLIHESLLVEEDGTARFVDIRRRRGVMARLFEEFVANFYEAEQDRYRVLPQPHLHWHEASSPTDPELTFLPVMRPDVVLVAPHRRIILDTKFYREALATGRHGGQRVRSNHLYQVFAYIENRNAAYPSQKPHEGLLLYPVVDTAFSYVYRIKGHLIHVKSIDLDQDWWKIHEDLLRLIDAENYATKLTDTRRALSG